MKRCSRCGKVKMLEDFALHNKEKDGKQSWCKGCKASYKKEVYVPLNDNKEPRTGSCVTCGEEFLLLSKKRKYCSNTCRFTANKGTSKRLEWKKENQEKRMLYRTRHSAKSRNIPFELQEKDIIIPEKCPVLGLTLEVGKDKASDNSPSLDKIIPSLGYTVGNVRVISQRANLLKSNATLEELRLVYEDALAISKTETTILREGF